MEVRISNRAPDLEEFMTLRTAVGWTNPKPGLVQQSLNNSLFHVCAHIDSKLVGYGRIVGDGAMYFYLQDIVISPEYQNQDVGRSIMKEIESFVAENAMPGATIGLLAACGKEAFYSQFGYSPRTGEPLGLGMCKFVE
ncbi:GNAT family N-acetyltransferase [Shewanella halotolerans]|uniref:GNAT family N-acetyltransferase n=1 Tax=Shewanella halotolerans TaxID=2864204 RepID=UPI001C659DFB|nr:GNAT family N-acetyltransferase [Shewanella halotolerans]QYJ88207.1 GNAT family N-acetyltransferase [Shewanella halotolerans]